ncbi:chymopapain-like isoform X2 [Salvia hispanica]|nr:chymopapain-like isoform X2 [Salvia hispanica]
METDTCYAFAVTATMFGDEMARDGSSLIGSAQEFLDYIHWFRRPKQVETKKGPFDVKMSGYPTSFERAFRYAVTYGVSPDRVYPWLGTVSSSPVVDGPWDGIVKANGRIIQINEKIRITNYKILHTEEQVLRMLHNQPVTGGIYMPKNFINWKSKEILLVAGNVDAGLHAVTIIGYGSEVKKNICGREEKLKYYICQNSYGNGWGYKGYFKVLRHLIGFHYIPIGTCSPVGA